jgi:hypothetical protein
METKNKENNNPDYIKTPVGENPDLNNNPKDKTFNKLRDLQSLIKKESALKELCKKYFNLIKK